MKIEKIFSPIFDFLRFLEKVPLKYRHKFDIQFISIKSYLVSLEINGSIRLYTHHLLLYYYA